MKGLFKSASSEISLKEVLRVSRGSVDRSANYGACKVLRWFQEILEYLALSSMKNNNRKKSSTPDYTYAQDYSTLNVPLPLKLNFINA